MSKKGRALERLVRKLQAVLNDREDVAVCSPLRLRDNITGTKREFDVVITAHEGELPKHTVFEVRDRGRRVSTPEMEAFILKAHDAGVFRKVFVSSSGFSRPACVKAAHYGVECYDFGQVESVPWYSGAPNLVFSKTIESHAIELYPVDEEALLQEGRSLNLGLTFENVYLLGANGRKVCWSKVLELAWSNIQDEDSASGEAFRPGPHRGNVEIRFDPSGHLCWRGSSRRHRLNNIKIVIAYVVHVQALRNTVRSYAPSPQGGAVAETIQSEPFQALGGSVSINLVKPKDSCISVVLHHERTASATEGGRRP